MNVRESVTSSATDGAPLLKSCNKKKFHEDGSIGWLIAFNADAIAIEHDAFLLVLKEMSLNLLGQVAQFTQTLFSNHKWCY